MSCAIQDNIRIKLDFFVEELRNWYDLDNLIFHISLHIHISIVVEKIQNLFSYITIRSEFNFIQT